MLDIFNGTQIVAAVSSMGLGSFIVMLLSIFGAGVGAWIVMDYFHYKQTEALSKQMVDTTTIAVQSIQNMVTMAIASEQGMDITDKIIGTPSQPADKKT
jgi:hypothetical protein